MAQIRSVCVAMATVILNKIIVLKHLLFSQNESTEAVWMKLATCDFLGFAWNLAGMEIALSQRFRQIVISDLSQK